MIKIPKSRKKNKSKILLKKHSKVTFKEIKNVIKPNKEVIWFRQEPVILHIGAKRLSDAERMLTIAREIGLKRSDIISSKRLIMEIIGTEYISTMLVKDNKILVDDSYIEMLIIEANKNLERTRDKLRKFHSVISKRLT